MDRRRMRVAAAVAATVVSLLLSALPAGAVTATWSIQATPNRAGAMASGLDGVSCVSGTFCMAVGDLRNAAGRYLPLTARWSKGSWRNQAVPYPPGARTSGLSGVSCTSTTACMAVGVTADNGLAHGATLAEEWNGVTWAIQPTPSVTGGTFPSFTSVSCTAATDCMAVGNYTNSDGVVVALAEQWDGAAWTIQPTLIPAGAWYSYLSGVSCVSATDCTAVGYSNTSHHFKVPSLTLVEQWNGSAWAIQPTPNPAGAETSSLTGISCTSTTDCTAVGSFTSASPPTDTTAALVEQWNGAAWSIQPTPSPAGAVGVSLTGVSCISAIACAAVGVDTSTVTTPAGSENVQLTLAEQWNGANWAIQSAPSPMGTELLSLTGVSCSSRTVCAAVGYYLDASNLLVTLAERRS